MMFNDVFVLMIFVSYGGSCWLEGLGFTTEPSELVKPFFFARPMTLELLRLHQARQGFVCVNCWCLKIMKFFIWWTWNWQWRETNKVSQLWHHVCPTTLEYSSCALTTSALRLLQRWEKSLPLKKPLQCSHWHGKSDNHLGLRPDSHVESDHLQIGKAPEKAGDVWRFRIFGLSIPWLICWSRMSSAFAKLWFLRWLQVSEGPWQMARKHRAVRDNYSLRSLRWFSVS